MVPPQPLWHAGSLLDKRTPKYAIEIPTSVEHSYAIDKKNGNQFWCIVIRTEMYNNGIAFNIFPTGEQAPKGWHKVTGRLVYNVEMDFTRKFRWVLDDHKTPDPI